MKNATTKNLKAVKEDIQCVLLEGITKLIIEMDVALVVKIVKRKTKPP